MSVSLNNLQNSIYSAWSASHPTGPAITAGDGWVVDIYPDDCTVIISQNSKYYQVSYTQDANGVITFGADFKEVAKKESWEAVTKSAYLQKVVEAIKSGKRNSAADVARLEKIQALVAELLQEENAEADAEAGGNMMSLDDTMIYQGDALKAVGETDGDLKVGGYLVRFTAKGDYDISESKDRFSPDTDFDFEFPGKSTAYFNHGIDKTLKKRRLDAMTLTKDDVGVWAEGILHQRDEYEKTLAELAKAGKLGLSSGVPGHLVDRQPEGKGNLITSWPLGKDASYTHTPAEPRNMVMPLKSLLTAPVAAAAAEPTKSKSVVNEVNMTEEELQALLVKTASEAATKAAAVAVEEFKKAQPATVKAGVAADPATVSTHEMPYKSISGRTPEAKATQIAALGEQLLDIHNAQKGKGWSPKLLALKDELKATGMNEFISSEGGFALQPDFTDGLLDKMYNPPGTGTVIADVTRQPVSGNGFRAMAVDETSRVSSRRGGFLGYWIGEGLAPTVTKASFRRVGTDLEKIGILTALTNELMGDAPALGAWVMREAPTELRFQLEDKVFNGTGAGVPTGILNANALITVTKESGQASATIVTENITKMWARMPAYLMAGAKWYINQEILPQLVTLSIAVGVGGQVVPAAIYTMPSPQYPFGQLFGRPVQPIEYCAALGTLGDIVLANMAEYFVIDNGGIQSASSMHVYFTTDELGLRFIYRVNGFPWWASTMTPYKGTNTLSPFITLAAR